MDLEKINVILNVAQGVVKLGAPAVRKIVDQLEDKDEPTLADIEKLGESIKEPESYFDGSE